MHPEHWVSAPTWYVRVQFRSLAVPRHCESSPDLTCGRETTCDLYVTLTAPGGTYTVPSFARDNEVGGKGVIFGHKLKSPRTVLQVRLRAGVRALQRGTQLCRQWDHTLGSRSVLFVSHKSAFPLCSQNIGYPMPPGEKRHTVVGLAGYGDGVGGSTGSPHDADHLVLCPRGVHVLSRMPVPSAAATAPGGNCVVPSFAADNLQQRKGVPFGTKLPVFPPYVTVAWPSAHPVGRSWRADRCVRAAGRRTPALGRTKPTRASRRPTAGTTAVSRLARPRVPASPRRCTVPRQVGCWAQPPTWPPRPRGLGRQASEAWRRRP